MAAAERAKKNKKIAAKTMPFVALAVILAIVVVNIDLSKKYLYEQCQFEFFPLFINNRKSQFKRKNNRAVRFIETVPPFVV